MSFDLSKFFLFSLFWLFLNELSQAQIIPDDTLPQNSTVDTNCNTSCQIEGGTTKNGNLFHSFKEFSVPPNVEAVFNHSSKIKNIFTRVTGSSLSKIEGTISTNIKSDIGNQGVANLFLINPNGIIFGANAQLNIGGSFLATTADGIFFSDNSQFSTSNPKKSSLLTVSVPIGLQFGKTANSVRNFSRVTESVFIPDLPESEVESVGLKTNLSKTLALVGGDIFLEGGILTAPAGNVEVISSAPNSFVNLNSIAQGWIIKPDNVTNSQTIELSKSARIQTNIFSSISSDLPRGDIRIIGKEVIIRDNSRIFAENASKSNGSSIFIQAHNLTLQSGGIIEATTRGIGRAGNIEIIADSLQLIGKNIKNNSGIFSQTSNSGNAGEIKVTVQQLILQDGARIAVSTLNKGQGGNLTVNASEFVEVIGRSPDGRIPSSLLAQADGGKAQGDGGNLTLNTKRLIVREGGIISVGSIENTANRSRLGFAQGNGGELVINTTESIEVSGFGSNEQGEIALSTLLSESQGMGNAGNLEITTPQLTVTNQGEVNVSATGTGEAGSLTINATNITLNEGTLTATTQVGDKGNITINNAETLLLRNNSKITTNATTEATGGKITITADAIAGLENSDITANAQQGKGGQITINASRGVIGLEVREQQGSDTSDITAFSELAPEFNGEIIFNTPDIDPLNGLIELPNVPLDAEAIFAQNLCKFEDGKIAKGSSFIITGKGGITPTSKNPLGDRDRVVNWANRDDLRVSQDGVVGVIQRTNQETLETGDRVIQQAQGWVITADGSVWLTADNPQTTLQNSAIVHPDCRKSLVQ